jgi:hypothetical protein
MDNRNKIYQGEFAAKRDVFDKFKDCISKIEKGESTPKDHNWEDIQLILKMIFKEASLFDNDSEGDSDD